MRYQRKQYLNPFTRESMTAVEWAERLKLKSGRVFQNRYHKRGPDDRCTWMTIEEANLSSGKPADILTSPDGIADTRANHARRIGISKTGLVSRLKKWGPDDPRTWMIGRHKPGPKAGFTKHGNAEWHALDDTEDSMIEI